MPTAIVIGGGLSGLASAAALGSCGFKVDLFEARGLLGGRATYYALNAADGTGVLEDCNHILLRSYATLLDLYEQLHVPECIVLQSEYNFHDPAVRISITRAD